MKLYDKIWAFKQTHPFIGTLLIMPWRVREAFSDPQRRRQLLGQVVLCYLSSLPFCGWLGAIGVVGLNFALYEFVGETLFTKYFGPYWERGPRHGERFINE